MGNTPDGRDPSRLSDASTGALRLTLDLPEGVHFVSALRKTARCLLESVGVPKRERDDIEVLIGELATNAVLHAGSSDGYRVEVEYRGNVVLVIVSDRGRGFAPDAVPDPGTPRADTLAPDSGWERMGGWGLPLVRSLADKVDILPTQPHGTTVRVEKRLASPPPSAP